MKRSKLTVPLHVITPALKRTAEMAISEGGVIEEGIECNIQIGDGKGLITIAEGVSGVCHEGGGKGKLSAVGGEEVYLAKVTKTKVKRRYIKQNMEYWSNTGKVVILSEPESKIQKEVQNQESASME